MQSKEKKIISECIHEFESKTQVELVLVVTPRSATYLEYILIYTTVLNIIVLFVASYFGYELNYNLVFEMIFVYLVSFLFGYYFELIRFFIPKKIKLQNIEKASLSEFSKNKIYNTEERSGVLLYYSRFERSGKILIDEGVKEKISDIELQKFEFDFITALNEDRKAFINLGTFIRVFGVYWGRKWPAKNNINELSNDVVGKIK